MKMKTIENMQKKLMETRTEQKVTKTHTQKEKLLNKLTLCQHGIPNFACYKCREEREIKALPANHPRCKHDKPEGFCEQCRDEAAKQQEQDRINKIKKRENDRLLDLQQHPEKKLIKFNIPKRYLNCSFENFKTKSNLSKNFENIQDGLFLTGKTGSGKTHIAISVLRSLVMNDNIEDAVFINASRLLLAIRESFKEGAKKTEKDIVDYYSQVPFLILDDLGSEKTSEFAITTLYIIIDTRYNELLSTIITTNLSLSQIEKKIGSRIASRLAGMQSFNFTLPDYRKKGA